MNFVNAELRDGTVSKLASTALKASDYKVPDRRGISAQFVHKNWVSKPCAKISMSHASYTTEGKNAFSRAPLPEWVFKSQHRSDAVYGRPSRSSYTIDGTMDLSSGTTRAVQHLPGYHGTLCTCEFFLTSLLYRLHPDVVKESRGRSSRVRNCDADPAFGSAIISSA